MCHMSQWALCILLARSETVDCAETTRVHVTWLRSLSWGAQPGLNGKHVDVNSARVLCCFPHLDAPICCFCHHVYAPSRRLNLMPFKSTLHSPNRDVIISYCSTVLWHHPHQQLEDINTRYREPKEKLFLRSYNTDSRTSEHEGNHFMSGCYSRLRIVFRKRYDLKKTNKKNRS